MEARFWLPVLYYHRRIDEGWSVRKLTGFCFGLGALLVLASLEAAAGGSGFNVFVVVNQNSSNSVQLGNYYAEQRHIPPQNYLRINWPGTNIEWTISDFTNTLLNPLRDAIFSRQLTNQIDYVVLSMDIPYRVTNGTNGQNSTTSALFYGFKSDNRDLDTCPLAPSSFNNYSGTEAIFRNITPFSTNTNYFLATMLTSTSLDLAKQIVDHGVQSDFTYPTQPVLLSKTSDTARNVRYVNFDNAVFNGRLKGLNITRTNDPNPPPFSVAGFETGYYFYSAQANNFVPGAMADNLTSFGGLLFENTGGQTTLLSFLQAGAAGSFGTVVEPCNYLSKFPAPLNYFYQARGFSLAECYYQSLGNPYQGLVVGEPLAAPFAHPAAPNWISPGYNAVLTGTANLSAQFTPADPRLSLRHAELFMDGTWLQTITNILPGTGDILTVTVNGVTTNYVVPTNASIRSVTTGLASVLTNSAFSGPAKITAFTRGDRIELQSTDTSLVGSQLFMSVASSNSSNVVTTFINAAGSNFLDSVAWGFQTYTLTGIPGSNDFLTLSVTLTNGTIVNLALTNDTGAALTPFAQSFINLINSTPPLNGTDGVVAEDLETLANDQVQFHLRALSEGLPAARIKSVLTTSSLPTVTPTGTNDLTRNLSDLRPRNHVYLSCGASNLSLNFTFNTIGLPDGYHELEIVAYEGTHVHTQSRAAQQVRIQNTPLAATFATLLGGSNTALEAVLQLNVNASSNVVSTIELFSTGGLLAVVSNQSAFTFGVTASNLDLGLHPFYAVVTAVNGTKYRTETEWIRLVSLDAPFPAQISGSPPLLVWPAAAGRKYDILGTTNLDQQFQLRGTVTPISSLGQWMEPSPAPAQLFYRVRVSL